MVHSFTTTCQGVVVSLLIWSAFQVVSTDGVNFNCDFQTNLCGWTTAMWSDGNWTRSNHRTPTSETGPNNGHSTNNKPNYYIYLEANNFLENGLVTEGKRVALVSPPFSTCMTFTFFYHMYGIGIGNLTTGYISQDSQKTVLWTKEGNQSNSWNSASIMIRNTDSTSYQVYVEATTGLNIKGDIAIDDLRLYTSSCYPTTTKEPRISSNPAGPTEPNNGAPEPESFNMLYYIVPIPFVVLLIAGIIGIIFYCRKKDKPSIPEDVEDVEDNGSEYAELDEMEMTSHVTQNGNVVHSEDNKACTDSSSGTPDHYDQIDSFSDHDQTPSVNPHPHGDNQNAGPFGASLGVFTTAHSQSRDNTASPIVSSSPDRIQSMEESDYLEPVSNTGRYPSSSSDRNQSTEHSDYIEAVSDTGRYPSSSSDRNQSTDHLDHIDPDSPPGRYPSSSPDRNQSTDRSDHIDLDSAPGRYPSSSTDRNQSTDDGDYEHMVNDTGFYQSSNKHDSFEGAEAPEMPAPSPCRPSFSRNQPEADQR